MHTHTHLNAAQRDTENQKLCAQQFIAFYIKYIQSTYFSTTSMEPCLLRNRQEESIFHFSHGRVQ